MPATGNAGVHALAVGVFGIDIIDQPLNHLVPDDSRPSRTPRVRMAELLRASVLQRTDLSCKSVSAPSEEPRHPACATVAGSGGYVMVLS